MLHPGCYLPFYYEMLVTFTDIDSRKKCLTFFFFYSFLTKCLRPTKEQTMTNMSEGCTRLLICPLVHVERSSCSVFLQGTEVTPGVTFLSLSDYGT